MSSEGILFRMRELGLAAWQANFVESFLEVGSSAFQVLVAPPGTGKSHTAAALVAEFTRSEPRRILVLVPTLALRFQWALSVRRVEPENPVQVIDRRAFRELVATFPLGQSPWSAAGVYIMSQEFAKLEDVASSLCTSGWDLVIVDDAHRLVSPQRATLLFRLLEAGVLGRLLMLTTVRTPAFQEWLMGFAERAHPSKSTILVEWSGPQTDWDGTIVDRARVFFREIPYRRGSEEVEFIRKLQSVLPDLERASGRKQFLADLLLRRASSSLYAVDQSLQRLRNSLSNTGDPLSSNPEQEDATPLELGVDQDDKDATSAKSKSWPDRSIGLGLIEECLDALELVTSDEKLNAATGLIRSILGLSTDHLPQIYVMTRYADTASYLHTAFEDAGIPSFKLTGSIGAEYRTLAVERFLRNGGILVATDASTERLTFPQVAHVVDYDLPAGPSLFEQRLSRFNPYGRTIPCTIYFLEDESGVIPHKRALVEQLTLLRGSETGGSMLAGALNPEEAPRDRRS